MLASGLKVSDSRQPQTATVPLRSASCQVGHLCPSAGPYLRRSARANRSLTTSYRSWSIQQPREVDLQQVADLVQPLPFSDNAPLLQTQDGSVVARQLNLLNYLVVMADRGQSPEIRSARINCIESHSRAGKTSMASELFRQMRSRTLEPAGLAYWPQAARILQDTDASTTCLLSFKGADGSHCDRLAQEDLELLRLPASLWGIRVLARAHFHMSTSEFRDALREKGLRLSPFEHSLEDVAEFLRRKHPSAALWFLGLCVDDFDLIRSQAEQLGVPVRASHGLCRSLLNELLYFSATENCNEPTRSLKQGILLLPAVFGTALGELEDYRTIPARPTWNMQTLSNLSFDESVRMLQVLLAPSLGASAGRTLDTFLASGACQTVIENMGGVPGAISTLADAMQSDKACINYFATDRNPENEMGMIARRLQDEVCSSFGVGGLESRRKDLLGGETGELVIILLAITGVAVDRELQIGDKNHQTLEFATQSGMFTLRPNAWMIGPHLPYSLQSLFLYRVDMAPFRLQALMDSAEAKGTLRKYLPPGLELLDLFPPLEVPSNLQLLETMSAARISAHAFIWSEIIKQHWCAVKDIFPGAVADVKQLLEVNVRLQPMAVCRDMKPLLRKVSATGDSQGEDYVEWMAKDTVEVACYSRSEVAGGKADNVKSVPFLDFTKVILHDAPGTGSVAFDVRFVVEHEAGLPLVFFLSAKRAASEASNVRDKLLAADHYLARATIREQGASQDFLPWFVYVTTENPCDLGDTLAQLEDDNDVNILVIPDRGLPEFMPILRTRRSLMGLAGSGTMD